MRRSRSRGCSRGSSPRRRRCPGSNSSGGSPAPVDLMGRVVRVVRADPARTCRWMGVRRLRRFRRFRRFRWLREGQAVKETRPCLACHRKEWRVLSRRSIPFADGSCLPCRRVPAGKRCCYPNQLKSRRRESQTCDIVLLRASLLYALSRGPPETDPMEGFHSPSIHPSRVARNSCTPNISRSHRSGLHMCGIPQEQRLSPLMIRGSQQ